MLMIYHIKTTIITHQEITINQQTNKIEMPKQPREQRTPSKTQQDKEKSQLRKKRVIYTLCSLIVNEGIDLYANCFSKRNCITQFFYIRHYSLDRFDQLCPQHPMREEIVKEFDNYLSFISTGKPTCCSIQNVMANTLLNVCHLLGIQLFYDKLNYNVSIEEKKTFPKIRGILFENSCFNYDEFYEVIEIEQKVKQFVQRRKLNKRKHLIKLTSKGMKVFFCQLLKQYLTFELVDKNSINGNVGMISSNSSSSSSSSYEGESNSTNENVF